MTAPFGHENWYQCDGTCTDQPRGARYEFPLPEVKNAPVPSQADYEPKNVAWLIEMFASILGTEKENIALRYENNTPKDKDDDIEVKHPGDKLYYPEAAKCIAKSPEQVRYEQFAKKSALLKLYQDNSPAKITYFNPTCD